MSIEAVAYALTQTTTRSAVERLVLVGLANHAHADGRHAFPSVSTLAGYAHVTPRTVQRTLRELESRGLITKGDQSVAGAYIDRPDRRPTVWNVVLRPVDNPSRGDTHVAPSPVDNPERGDTRVANGVTPVSPEPSLEPKDLRATPVSPRETVVVDGRTYVEES